MKLLVIGKEGRIQKYSQDLMPASCDISYVPLGASEEEILNAGQDADFILADSIAEVSAYVIEQMPNLKMIHAEGVGFNGIDTEAAKKRKIYVCNCKGINAAAVAEQAVLLMLGLLRDVCNGDKSVRNGTQADTKDAYMSAGNLKELGECTVGIVGFGDIGRATAKLVRAFGAKVVYYDCFRADAQTEEDCKVTYSDLESLLTCSDIVSLHVPVLDSTRKMADAGFFSKMKKGSYFINTARGELVDGEALLDAVRRGRIAGAGLDTIEGEPVSADHPILQAEKDVEDKLIFSCHVGGITGSTFKRGHKIIWSNIKKVSEGERPDHVVNSWD